MAAFGVPSNIFKHSSLKFVVVGVVFDDVGVLFLLTLGESILIMSSGWSSGTKKDTIVPVRPLNSTFSELVL